MRVHAHVTAERRRRVEYLTRAGYYASEIAAKLGCNERTVERDRKALGISLARPALTEWQLATAHRLLVDGAGYAEAARTVGCAGSTLLRRFPGMGLTPSEAMQRRRVNEKIEKVTA